jgi:hypothetical protein
LSTADGALPSTNGHHGHGTNGHRRERSGVRLGDHLDALRATDLREVYSFWSGGEAPELPKKELVRQVQEAMTDEGTVYRRVRTLTRKVVDVLLLLLRRSEYRSDLPGLFRRLPGEEQVNLEYHEAEAGLRALLRRGFVGESADRAFATHGRAVYSVPSELGDLLAGLFREETRTPRSLFSLEGFLQSLSATEREAARARFPALGSSPGPGDARAVLGPGGGRARIEAIEPPALRALAESVLAKDGGILTRAEAAARDGAVPPWDRKAWAQALETAGAGTVARLSLSDYGISCEDEALVLFHEVVEDARRRAAPAEPEADEVRKAGGDLVADVSAFLGAVRRTPVRMTREGDVHRAARKRIEEGFVSQESALAGAPEVWAHIRAAADRLGLVATDAEGFLVTRDEADRWAALPLDQKIAGLYRHALEGPGPRGRSLHVLELRGIVADLLREEPSRWWAGDDLFVAARLRYLATLDARRIKDRYRDRHFGAFATGRESLPDLLADVRVPWLRTLHLLGVVDVALRGDEPVAVRLSALGARLLGATTGGESGSARPLLVAPDFEIVVLPEGDVTDVVHALDAWAPRVRTGDVAHYRLTKESVEAAVAEGRPVTELVSLLEARARGSVPRNVVVTLEGWAAGVVFATLERGVVMRLDRPEALDRVLALPGVRALVTRRLSPTEALLREEPKERRLLADLRAEGVVLKGP